jgi:hypothetical protein
LVSITVGREQFRNAEPRFYTAWTQRGHGVTPRLTSNEPTYDADFVGALDKN